MAKKTKHRRKRGPTPPSSGRAGPFRMVVAANPGSSVTVVPELHLLKAALLYGDKVTVLSPVTTMFLRVEGLQKFSPREQIELMRRVSPILMPAEDVPAFQLGIAGVDDLEAGADRRQAATLSSISA